MDGLEKENIGNNSNSPMRTESDNGRAARELKVIFKPNLRALYIDIDFASLSSFYLF